MFSTKQVVRALVLSTLTASTAAAQGPMELVVNIPAGRLDVMQGGERVRSFPVSVGTAMHATPTHEGTIRRVVWNPTWTPPPDAAWARNETPKGPGWGNPMGRVKLHLFSDIYVHGTPSGNERRLGNPASHGCIRMANRDVLQLAQMVMEADGGSNVSPATVQNLIRNPSATREVSLAGRVRVRVIYRLTEVDGDSVTLHPDVYGRARSDYAQRVRLELEAAGADAAPVMARIASITRSPATRVRIPRSEFVLPERVPVTTVNVGTAMTSTVTTPATSTTATVQPTAPVQTTAATVAAAPAPTSVGTGSGMVALQR